MLVPGLLVIYLGFDAGGYFAGTTGAAAAAIALLLAVRIITAQAPFSGRRGLSMLAVAGIAALALLSLVSQTWSHAPARALLAFNLAGLYLGLTALTGTVAQPASRRRTLVYGLLAAVAAICAAGLATRLAPGVFPLGAQFDSQRLSYPVSYWNSLGMLAALGVLLGVHVGSDRDAPWPVRAIAAGLVPAFGVTLLLTFSRGSIASLAIGLVLYVVLAPRTALVTTVIATAPFAAVAAHVAYDATALATTGYAEPAGVHQGHHLALVLAVCCAAAAALRGLGTLLERRMPVIAVPRRASLAPAAVLVVAVIVLAAVRGGWIDHQYRQFVDSTVSATTGPTRARLGSVSNNGRVQLWQVAWHAFTAHPLRGDGAGTYVELWDRRRMVAEPVQNAHSLYLETLAELGIPGAIALLCFLAGLLLGAGRALWRPAERPMAALATAALIAWCLHSAVDWDWQMPVVMVPVFALAATAAAGIDPHRPRAGGARRRAPAWLARGALAACAVALAVAPAFVAVSQASLDSAVDAFTRGDCPAAIADARSAHSAVGSRPEPLEIIGYCEAREGEGGLATQTIGQAISRDPADWEFHYALAVVTAAHGDDPTPQLRVAERLDPLEPLLSTAADTFRATPRRHWRQVAERLALDVS